MAQFIRYKNNGESRDIYPFFVDVQSELLESLNTRMVIPLIFADMLASKAPEHLCPTIHIDHASFILLTHQMTSVPVSILTDPVDSLETFRTEIIAAIDLLVTGV